MTYFADKLHVYLASGRFEGDAYGLQTTLRKATKFTLDTASSRKISDFSLEVAKDVDSTRQIALPPFPITWFEFNNTARLARSHELNISQTRAGNIPSSADNAPIPTVGWLVERHPTQHTAYRLVHVGDLKVANKPFVAPWTWMWDIEGHPLPWAESLKTMDLALRSHYAFGIDPKIGITDVRFGVGYGSMTEAAANEDFLMEFVGELRNCWGLLVALGSLPTIDHAVIRLEGGASLDEPIKVRGKTLDPFILRQITLHIPRLKDVSKVVNRCIEGVRKRRHAVRGHWRHYRNIEGEVTRKVWINNHERGDESLGRVEHTYRIVGH